MFSCHIASISMIQVWFQLVYVPMLCIHDQCVVQLDFNLWNFVFKVNILLQLVNIYFHQWKDVYHYKSPLNLRNKVYSSILVVWKHIHYAIHLVLLNEVEFQVMMSYMYELSEINAWYIKVISIHHFVP